MADLLVHHWSHPTTPAGTGWDIVQTGVVRLITEKGFSARAALGEAEVIRVIVDDPTGIADYKTLHRWYLVETATAGSQLVWNGYISDQFIDRGEEGDLIFPTGTGRRWELEITQENTLLGFRVIQGTPTPENGVRPAESPGARLAWILGSAFLSTVVDHGLIDWTALNALPDMDATDYRKQTAGDVLRNISLVTTFNHYIRYRDAISDIELAFYDSNTSELDTSTLRVSNLESDVDFTTTWPPHHPVRLHRKGDRVSAGVYVVGDGVTSYGYRLPTSHEFGFRDMVVDEPNTKTQAQADRVRDNLLTQHSTQDERITGLRIQVPAANLNDVKHGQRMEARFVHLPGWEDFRWARVISKAFSRPENETQALYDVDLELSPQKIACPTPTPSASIPPLLNGSESSGVIYGDALGILQYTRPGIIAIETPTPYNAGRWHFPDYNVGGTTDYAGNCVANRARWVVSGDGTLTIPTIDPGDADALTLALQYRDPVSGIITVETQTGNAGDTFVFVIDTEDMAHCTNWVELSGVQGASVCGHNSFGLSTAAPATWVLA